MTYSDKDKEREATRERVRRYRESQKGVTSEGVTEQGVTPPRMVLGQDLKPKVYDPKTDGVDGWHKNTWCVEGKPYILRHLFANGYAYSYVPGEAEFSYFDKIHQDWDKLMAKREAWQNEHPLATITKEIAREIEDSMQV